MSEESLFVCLNVYLVGTQALFCGMRLLFGTAHMASASLLGKRNRQSLFVSVVVLVIHMILLYHLR